MVQAVMWIVIFGAVSLLFAAPMITTTKSPETPLKPGHRDRCPVCGMFVMPYPEWIAQVRLRDGSTVFFDGCKDLFRYLLLNNRHRPEGSGKGVAAIFVTNYYDGETIAARNAYFVVGSDVMGPMGPELVPHRSYGAAADFVKDHHGLAILRFDDINEGVIRAID